MTEEQAKIKIQNLISKYEAVKVGGKIVKNLKTKSLKLIKKLMRKFMNCMG